MAYKDKEKNKQYYQNNRKRILEYYKQYRKNHPEKTKKYDKEYQKQWRKNHPKKMMEKKLKKYNLSHEDWLEMWESQDERCAICGKSFDKPSGAYIDHNHETGEIRGLLCNKCNLGIGFLNDDPELTMNATRYLLGEV